jgi:hypothetical protein
MSNLSEIWIKTDTLETLLSVAKKKELKGVSLTISTNDDTNSYGQNISSYVSQSKEEREIKKPRFYVANGKVFWTDGSIKIADKTQAESTPTASSPESEEMPF